MAILLLENFNYKEFLFVRPSGLCKELSQGHYFVWFYKCSARKLLWASFYRLDNHSSESVCNLFSDNE